MKFSIYLGTDIPSKVESEAKQLETALHELFQNEGKTAESKIFLPDFSREEEKREILKQDFAIFFDPTDEMSHLVAPKLRRLSYSRMANEELCIYHVTHGNNWLSIGAYPMTNITPNTSEIIAAEIYRDVLESKHLYSLGFKNI